MTLKRIEEKERQTRADGNRITHFLAEKTRAIFGTDSGTYPLRYRSVMLF